MFSCLIDILIHYTCSSGSSLSIDIGDICGYSAQHIGVAKVKKNPHNTICKGAGAHFIFLNKPFCSIASIITGDITKIKTIFLGILT